MSLLLLLQEPPATPVKEGAASLSLVLDAVAGSGVRETNAGAALGITWGVAGVAVRETDAGAALVIVFASSFGPGTVLAGGGFGPDRTKFRCPRCGLVQIDGLVTRCPHCRFSFDLRKWERFNG